MKFPTDVSLTPQEAHAEDVGEAHDHVEEEIEEEGPVEEEGGEAPAVRETTEAADGGHVEQELHDVGGKIGDLWL